MNKHIRALKRLVIIAAGLYWATVVPMHITKYGTEHGIWGFGIAPVNEAYSVFIMAWVGGQALLAITVWGLYCALYSDWH